MLDSATLEEMNVSNLIEFYRTELEKILKGVSPYSVLTLNERRSLRKNGILEFDHPDWLLTEKVKAILKGN